MKIYIKSFFLLSLTLVITGCIPINSQLNSYKVEVDAIVSNVNIIGKKYYLYQSSHKDDQLQYDEFSKYIDNAIQDSGYQKVSNINKADLIIIFYYGITDPETSHIPGNKAIAQNYQALAIESSKAKALNGNQRLSNAMMTGFYNGLASSSIQDYAITYYGKWLAINAYKKNTKEIWKLKVSRIDSNDNIRQCFPSMLKCTQQYIAENFNGKISCSAENNIDF